MAKEVDSIHLLSCAIEASLGNDFPAFAFRLPGEDGFYWGACEPDRLMTLADVEAFPRGRGDYVLAPAVLQKMLSEVSDGEERQKLLRLIFDVIRSDGRLAKGEAALFWHAVDTWNFRAAETRAALYRQRRPVAARAARRSVRPL
jgi:hypothetical protein